VKVTMDESGLFIGGISYEVMINRWIFKPVLRVFQALCVRLMQIYADGTLRQAFAVRTSGRICDYFSNLDQR
jgi:hypothetical protein